MKAIILNAGKGSRLSPHTDNQPKCLLRVGDKTLLDHQLAALLSVGVRDVVLVLGYRRGQIIDHVAEYDDLSFTVIENDDYATTNTAYSLWLARHEMTDDFVYFNGDVLFHPEILRRLAGATAANALAVERKPCGDEEVKVLLDGSRITDIGKHLSPAESYGEFIGLARFSKTIAPLFRRTLEQVIEQEQLLGNYFEVALERMSSSVQLTAVDITDLPCTEIDFPEDLDRARNLIYPLLADKEPLRRKRVLFYAERNLHVPFLEPVHDCLKERHDVELAFSAPPFSPALDGRTGWGLPPEEMARLAGKGRFVEKVEEFAPDLTIVADVCTTLGECGKLVNVGHGIISKGYYYTGKPVVRRENLADLTCVPGPWHKEILERNVFSPIVVTGFVKSDRLFGPAARPRQEYLDHFGIPRGKRVVLFAPTFNPELSAIPCVGERIAELCDGDTVLLIKLHGMTDRAWTDMYRTLAARHGDVHFVEDPDISSAMAAADVMVSDVSSAFVEFLFLNRPVVLFDNPRRGEYHNFDAEDIEYRVRDACLTVGTVEELKLAVRLSLANPGEFEAKRLEYAAALCYGRDGKSAQRVADAAMQLLDGGFSRNMPRLVRVILLWEHRPEIAELEYSIAEIRRKNEGVALEIVCIGPLPHDLDKASLEIRSWIDCPAPRGDSLHQACAGDAGYFVFLKGGRTLPAGWLFWLHNYFTWFAGTGAVQALSSTDDYQPLAARLFPDRETPAPAEIAKAFLRTFMGSDVTIGRLADECLMLDRQTYDETGPFALHLPAVEAFADLGLRMNARGRGIRLAADVFIYPAEAPMAAPAPTGTRATTTQHSVCDAPPVDSRQSAADLIARARRCRDEKNYRQALELYEQAGDLAENAVLVDKGDCCANMGNFADAEHFYTRALLADPAFIKAHVGIGVVKLLTGRTDEAETAFSHALRLAPDEARALCGLGMVRQQQGLNGEGFDLFSRALDLDPENLPALHESTKLAYVLGRFGETAARMRTYLMYHPGDVDILFSFAGLLYKMNKPGEAREVIERVLALSPDYEGAEELLAKIGAAAGAGGTIRVAAASPGNDVRKESALQLKDEGRFAEALAEFTRLMDEGDRTVLADTGDCLAHLGRGEEAAGRYRQALRENAADLKALVGLGVVGLLREKPLEARQHLTAALGIDRHNSRALSGMGMACNLQGNRTEAFDWFRKALDADPEQLAALNGLVGCSYELGRFGEAEKYLTEYLLYHPGDLDMLYTLAGIQYKGGNPEAARDSLEKVLLFEPCYQGGRELLERIQGQFAA